MCVHIADALLTCMIVSSDPLRTITDPIITHKEIAKRPHHRHGRAGFPLSLLARQSAGWYALELYVRHACTPDAPRAAHRRISAHAQSTPSRAQVQHLGPNLGWRLLYFLIARAHDAYHCRPRSWLDHGHGLSPTARCRNPTTIWVAVLYGFKGGTTQNVSRQLESTRAAHGTIRRG